MSYDPIREKIEENHRLLEQMYTVLGLCWVNRFLRLYGGVSEWLHAGPRDKLRMLGGRGRRSQTYRFAENLSAWMARSHENLNEIRRAMDAGGIGPRGADPSEGRLPAAEQGTADRLSLPEYRFYAFKQAWLRGHAVSLSEVQGAWEKGLVSVILPVFNGEAFVSQSIESVLAQSYDDLELIIVDDGSTDGTPAITDAFAARDSRVRVLHQTNQKLPRALNAGFQAARGEFLTWTSADNVMHPDCLARLTAELQSHPQTAMAYANLRLIDETGAPIRENGWYPDGEHPEWVIFPECVLELNTRPDNYVGAAFLYRASAAAALGGYSPNRYGIEDYDFWMRMNECFDLRHTAFRAPVYDYRFHPGSLTARDKELKITENRHRTMLWDEFRRQYLPGPAFWRMDGAATHSAWGRRLLSCIEQAGHVAVEDRQLWRTLCENPYFATIELWTDGAEPENVDTPPAPACRAYVGAKPCAAQKAWCDVYLSLSPVDTDDFLLDRRGWFHFASERAMFAFLDIRAKNARLLQMETNAEAGGLPEREQADTRRAEYTRHLLSAGGDLAGTEALAWLRARLAETPVWASVIVPVYNVRAYLDRCVESVVRQTAEKIEIFLIDDGSTDGSGALCDAWAARDARVRVIHQKNGGLSAARNAGIDAATGKYLAFIDSDDWIEAEMLENLLFAAEVCGAQIAECNFENVFPDSAKPEPLRSTGWLIADRRKALREELEWGRFKAVAWNKIYLRTLFADGLRYPVGKYHEDEFLTHRLFYAADRLVSIGDALYHYDRTRTDSITGKALSERGADLVEALRAHCAFLKEHRERELYETARGLYLRRAEEFLAQCEREKPRGMKEKSVRKWLREERKAGL